MRYRRPVPGSVWTVRTTPFPLGGELERRIDQAPLAALLGQQALDDHACPQAQPPDRAPAHPHDRDLAGAVEDDRLERLVPLERPNGDPPDDARDLHALPGIGPGDPNAAGDALGPGLDLLGVAVL